MRFNFIHIFLIAIFFSNVSWATCQSQQKDFKLDEKSDSRCEKALSEGQYYIKICDDGFSMLSDPYARGRYLFEKDGQYISHTDTFDYTNNTSSSEYIELDRELTGMNAVFTSGRTQFTCRGVLD